MLLALTSAPSSAADIELAEPPSNTSQPGIVGATHGDAFPGNDLSCSPGTWDGTPPLDFAYQWLFNSTPVAGADQAIFVVPAFERSGTLTCTVTASNEAGHATAFSPAVFVLVVSCCDRPEVLPASTIPPEITGYPVPGSSLLCSPGAWSMPSPTFTYQWLSNGVAIPGATTATYMVPSVSGPTTVSCEVTATTPVGSATARSPGVEIAFVVLGPPYGIFSLCGRGVELFQANTIHDELNAIASCSNWASLRFYRGGFGFHFTAPEPGVLMVRWYEVQRTSGRQATHRFPRRLFATARTTCNACEVSVHVTRLGSVVLRRRQSVGLVANASFTSLGRGSISVVRRIELAAVHDGSVYHRRSS